MNRIGLIATKTLNTYTQDKPINGGEWVSRVADLRNYQVYLNKAYTDGGTAILLSCDDNGCYLAQMHAIPGADGANNTIWIYIPKNIQVSGFELSAILRQLEQEQQKDVMDPMILGSLVSSEYPDAAEVSTYHKPETNGKLDVRYYGLEVGVSLSMLLNDLYQPEYMQCKYMFLLTGGVRLEEESLPSAEETPAEAMKEEAPEMPVVEEEQSSLVEEPEVSVAEETPAPAAPEEEKPEVPVVEKTPLTTGLPKEEKGKQLVTVTPTFDHGFIPYANGVPMEGPITLYAGEELVVTWQKEGYREVCLRYHVNHSIVLPPPAEDMRYVAITRNHFTVIDELGNTIEDADISIKGMMLSPGKTAYVLEREMGELTVEASAAGYVSKQQLVDIRTTEAVIALKREVGGRSPKRKKEKKERTEGTKMKPWLVILIVILSVIALVCAVVYFLNEMAQKEPEPELEPETALLDSLAMAEMADSAAWDMQEEMPDDSLMVEETDSVPEMPSAAEETPAVAEEVKPEPVAPVQITAKNLEDAYAYLNGHMAWTKEELEVNPATVGLFDALNTANLDKIKQILNKPELIRSGRVNSLILVVNKANPGRTDTYTKSDTDHKITIVDAYLNWLKN